MTSAALSRAVSTIAELGVADLVQTGQPQPVERLARASKTHEPSLYRILRSWRATAFFRKPRIATSTDHFERRELTKGNTWRSYSTKKTCQAYLTRWVLPHWRHCQLPEVRTTQVESWLRRLPLAKSSCAKIRNLMSILFNHACRYELFDRNPIYLVRQSAKRRTAPTGLMPAEIKALVENLGIRERTLVLLAVSTGLRQNRVAKTVYLHEAR